MNDLVLKQFAYNGVNVRTTEINNVPMFCLLDVCKCLDISNSRDVLNYMEEDGVGKTDGIDSMGRTQTYTYIDEGNLYKLLLRSNKPQAEPFQKWVSREVIPSIRKNGGYIMHQETLTPEQIVANALVVAQNIINEQKQQLDSANKQILEDKPKVEFYDRVGNTDRSISVGEFAKIIFDTKNLKIGQNRLFKTLREMGYLNSKKGKQYNLPKQTYMDKGWFEVVEYTLEIGGEVIPKPQTRITGKGQTVLVDKILSFVNSQRA